MAVKKHFDVFNLKIVLLVVTSIYMSIIHEVSCIINYNLAHFHINLNLNTLIKKKEKITIILLKKKNHEYFK